MRPPFGLVPALVLALWALCAIPGAAWAQFLSPGPLSNAHQKLEGDANCNGCHEGGGKGVANALCVECHKGVGARIDKGLGYHGRMAKNDPCAKCHVEHVGTANKLIRWPGGAKEAFNHAQTGWPLVGPHAQAKCDDCHNEKFLGGPKRPPDTYLGLSTTCAGCHKADDPHKGQFGDRACDACHVVSNAKWKEVPGFDHAKTKFPLRDKHADVKCEKCHEDGPSAKFAKTSTECASCHETPHPEAAQFGKDCTKCHSARGWAAVTYVKAEHKKFPLEGGHAKPDCKACHGEKAAKVPVPDCATCHKDAHGGRFGKKCDSCHQIGSFHTLKKGVTIDHDKTAFPLRGQHAQVQCASCHKNGRLRPIAHAACTDCHADPHKGEVGTKCEECHAVAGFTPALYPVAKHTGFALEGAHRAVACNDCHRANPKRALDFRVGVSACAECHKDPHRGQFAPRTCDACHTTAAFHGAGVKHDIWPLTGAHAKTACASCHDGGNFAGTPRECRDCHGDPHLGQFTAREPKKDCAKCHVTDGFQGTFDHTSVWALEGAHAKADCDACHKEVRVGDGRVTVRWRLGFHDCAKCHQNVHRKEAK